jgi:23S rRNA (guanosine2251-2'-O)-methyltransferase
MGRIFSSNGNQIGLRTSSPALCAIWTINTSSKSECRPNGSGRIGEYNFCMDVLYGLHPVEEALRAGRRRFDHILVARERQDQRLERLVARCREAGVRVRNESREQLTQTAKTAAHQGIVALVRPQEFLSIEDLFSADSARARLALAADAAATEIRPARLVLALDGVEDPQNLGALLRVADGAGVDGVVLTERRSAPLSAAALKASAGAAEHLRIARVVNLVRALEDLKRQNIWVAGLDERGTTDYDQFDLTGDLVIVLGREGAGLHDLVRRTCDHLLRIPMAGGVSSLNVSAAGAVVLYEAARQRRAMRSGTNSVQGSAPRRGVTRNAAPRSGSARKGLGS